MPSNYVDGRGGVLAASYIPRPRKSFVNSLEKVRGRGAPRWRDRNAKRIFEYDPLHGHIEGYNLQGKHIGVFDVISGELIGPAVKGRRIDV
ncbi:colicin E3/pyocin S6 family cytotoxin [uncultured Corynebacterium sp.]|uniref:colicin E3/pyocin S6 family cytotoxin n=1 Tax=uncultured Corynebacterium sp. TaxID=159447 RepID=UPI00345BB6B7